MKKLRSFEKILLDAKSIVVVGLSRDPLKDSFSVAKYLGGAGYNVIAVNPVADKILGKTVFHSLSEISVPVDIVVVFRPSVECAQIVFDALKLGPKMVWLQLGIENSAAKGLAEKKGVVFVQNKCIRTEHKRLALL